MEEDSVYSPISKKLSQATVEIQKLGADKFRELYGADVRVAEEFIDEIRSMIDRNQMSVSYFNTIYRSSIDDLFKDWIARDSSLK